jgi:hypothetical protein
MCTYSHELIAAGTTTMVLSELQIKICSQDAAARLQDQTQQQQQGSDSSGGNIRTKGCVNKQ